MKGRLHRLRQEMASRKLDAVLISQPENRFYLSGFDGSAGYLLVSGESATLATDFRYTEQAGRQAPDYNVFQISGPMRTWLPDLMADLDSGKLGFEAEHVSFATHRQLADLLCGSRKFHPADIEEPRRLRRHDRGQSAKYRVLLRPPARLME